MLTHHVLELGRILGSEKIGMPDLNKVVPLTLVVDSLLVVDLVTAAEVIVGLGTGGTHGLELAPEQGLRVFLFLVGVFLIHLCNLWEIYIWMRFLSSEEGSYV